MSVILCALAVVKMVEMKSRAAVNAAIGDGRRRFCIVEEE
ncbi:hypothetical protein A2U01_0095729 [Trifolium medium]|uniref:Uncharacterized protein n=1 Tax=Trifolium medium TaxID=97028 RepID=A0A392URR8_9FABA|nr:hypothetical protein [Trifolium medium]